MNNEEIKIEKKLSHNIKRIDLKEFTCMYQYTFSTNQWLESVDDMSCFGMSHNDLKDNIIECLVEEFRFSLNNVVFRDPAGRSYIEYLETLK